MPVTCKLFGVIPVKQVDVHVVEEEQVIPGGLPIGICKDRWHPCDRNREHIRGGWHKP